MFNDKLLSSKNLRFNFCETKNNVNDYFKCMEKLDYSFVLTNYRSRIDDCNDFLIECNVAPLGSRSRDEV